MPVGLPRTSGGRSGPRWARRSRPSAAPRRPAPDGGGRSRTTAPALQTHLRPPHGADQHQPLLRPAHTGAAGEAQEPGALHHRAGLLGNLASQRVDPTLLRLGATAGKTPPPAVAADQDDPATADAHRRRPMWGSRRRVRLWTPPNAPILTIAWDYQVVAVPGDLIHESDSRRPRWAGVAGSGEGCAWIRRAGSRCRRRPG